MNTFMNAGSFLLDKSKCCYLYDDLKVGESLEKMERARYQTIPVIERSTGHYLYSISEGDILFKIKSCGLPYLSVKELPIASIDVERLHVSVRSTADVDELAELIVNQNFVPIVDENEGFLGIVTRKSIIYYLLGLVKDRKHKAK